MSVKWTKEQQRVIELRDSNILVSAAAGSGKTAVLVQRIITMLTEDQPPADVNRLLIVTFTEAAAAEMKERIRNAIEKKLEEEPDNEHLRQQATLIHNARITTIHSFCLSVIREHFHTIGIDPGFRIGEEGELKLLKHDVLKEVLEQYYEEGTEAFLDFTEGYGGKRDDRKLEELVLKLFEFSRSYPDAEGWLADCVKAYEASTEEELEQAPYLELLKDQVFRYTKDARELACEALSICRQEDGPYMYEEALLLDQKLAEDLGSRQTYKELYEAASNLTFARLKTNRDKQVSVDKTAQVKTIREEIKSTLKDLKIQYFEQSPCEVLRDIQNCRPVVRVLTELVSSFSTAFEEAKRVRNMIDFGDMEQYALRILTEQTEEGLVPTAAAGEYQEMFREIMIDEYQDSNLIQEAILTSVSTVSNGRHNIFMVGDVKQSIYRFRLSRPELFMEKFDSYQIGKGTKQRIDLHKNFRSRGQVLTSVNFLFQQLMTKSLGGIEYDEQAALYVGADYPEHPGNETEVLLIDSEMEELEEESQEAGIPVRELEARAIAGRIRELMKTQEVWDAKSGVFRPVRYSDIVILTRSIKGWSDTFSRALNREGIPTYTGTKEGYFETREIGVLLDYLRVLNNRQQDLPMAAVLRSVFGGLSDEQLASVKSEFPDIPFHQAVVRYAVEGSDEQARKKTSVCLVQMDRFREMIPYTAIHELLWLILSETGYGDYVAALPAGEQRKANVDMLVEKAMAFESTSYKGLFNFIRYIEALRKYDVDYGEASLQDEQADTVRIMSIHKSKGLEFPIVIAAGMGKRFNQQDARGNVILHARLGAGLDAVNLQDRTKSSSLLKQIIQREEILEGLGEELRVLYVAFTRAKEKLILTGTLKNPEEKLENYILLAGQEEVPLSFSRLTKVSTYWDWILPALIRRNPEVPIQVHTICLGEIAGAAIEEELEGRFTREALRNWNTQEVYDAAMRKRLTEQFGYQYPHENVEQYKLKFTVSELKKREYLKEEGGEFLCPEPEMVPLIPSFRKEEETLTGASRGTAYHRILELLDFAEDQIEENLEEAAAAMVAEGKLTEEMAKCIHMPDIRSFLRCAGGQRMKNAARQGRLYKEQPFVLGVDMQELYPDSQEHETILVQGIIDVYFEEEDGLVVLDYKTDRVQNSGQLREKYHAQLEYYARALEQLRGKPVKEKLIYSFTLGEEIKI